MICKFAFKDFIANFFEKKRELQFEFYNYAFVGGGVFCAPFMNTQKTLCIIQTMTMNTQYTQKHNYTLDSTCNNNKYASVVGNQTT